MAIASRRRASNPTDVASRRCDNEKSSAIPSAFSINKGTLPNRSKLYAQMENDTIVVGASKVGRVQPNLSDRRGRRHGPFTTSTSVFFSFGRRWAG